MDQENKSNPVNIQKHLAGVDYPASKEDLMDAAENNNADESVLNMLRMLPEKDYESPMDVNEALGDMNK